MHRGWSWCCGPLSALHLLIKELLKKASGATPREEACLHPLQTTAG